MLIIGITGKYCAGKSTVCEYLKTKGFVPLSLSDELREIMEKKGLEITRENMIKEGNALRENHGNGYLAKLVLKKIEKDRNYVVDSLRNPDEIRELKKERNFRLWVLTANENKRFERIIKRQRAGDPKTIEEFKALEAMEAKQENKSAQNIEDCEKMGDMIIENNSSLAELFSKIDDALMHSPVDLNRPSWDEYFMNIAKEVATRSNCIKRKIGAVIVSEKRIVSTGYNGTPRGVKNCNEGGCKRCNSFAESGTRLDECWCSHAEENSIVQAAYHGISTKESTLYTTYSPCLTCSKMIINAGIKEVVYNAEYPLASNALEMLKEAGVVARKHKL